MPEATSTLPSLLLDPTLNLSNVGIFAISFGVLVWSSILYRSCGNKQDRENEQSIRDRVDSYSFRTTIIPLFQFVSRSLTEEMTVNVSSLPDSTDKKEFLEKCDGIKADILGRRDFSFVTGALVEIPEVMTAIERTIKLKKTIGIYFRLSNWLLWVSIVLLLIAILSVVLHFLKTPNISPLLVDFLLGAWVVVLVLWGIVCLAFHRVERRKNMLASI